MTTYTDKPKRGDYELADTGVRLIALIIDGAILGIITGILASGGRSAGEIAGFLVGVAYQWYFLTHWNGQTPGKRIMKIRVVRISGQPIDAADVIVRYVGYYIDSLVFGIGWLWALFDADKQCWHDKLAGTLVVRA